MECPQVDGSVRSVPLYSFEKYTPKDRGRWAYQPPKRPEVPKVENIAWVKTPIDAFVLARLEKEGLMLTKPADRATLLRRVTFDLTALPTSPEELDAFVKDPSPKAYASVVERVLLSSPHYRERWGQHWLDVVRHADTDGFEYDALRPDAWRYRDDVIRSFNNDKPFDRFILEHLAGDDLASGDQEALVAAPCAPKSLEVATIMPRPKWCCQRRFTITLAVKGFSGPASHCTRANRRSALFD